MSKRRLCHRYELTVRERTNHKREWITRAARPGLFDSVAMKLVRDAELPRSEVVHITGMVITRKPRRRRRIQEAWVCYEPGSAALHPQTTYHRVL